jgi:hypothetical protein
MRVSELFWDSSNRAAKDSDINFSYAIKSGHHSSTIASVSIAKDGYFLPVTAG